MRATPRCCACGATMPGTTHDGHDLAVDGAAGERVSFRWHLACLDADPWAQALGDACSAEDGAAADATALALYRAFRAVLIERHGAGALPSVLRVVRDMPDARRTLRHPRRWGLLTVVAS